MSGPINGMTLCHVLGCSDFWRRANSTSGGVEDTSISLEPGGPPDYMRHKQLHATAATTQSHRPRSWQASQPNARAVGTADITIGRREPAEVEIDEVGLFFRILTRNTTKVRPRFHQGSTFVRMREIWKWVDAAFWRKRKILTGRILFHSP